VCVALFAVLFGCFGVLSVHAFGPGYEPTYAASAEGFLHTGVPQLWRGSPNYRLALGGSPEPAPGPVYSGPTTGWAGPVGAAPLVGPAMALDALRKAVTGSDAGNFRKAAARLYARVLIALTALLVFWLALALYERRDRAVGLALAFGLTTLALPYTRIGMEPPLVFWSTAAFAAAYRARHRGSNASWLVAGLCAGFASATRNPAAPILISPIVVYALWPLLRGQPDRRIQRLALYLVPILICGALSIAYNVTRCDQAICGLSQQALGSANGGGLPTDKARVGFFEGLYGLLLSPGKSFFVASPIAVLGAVGLWRARRVLTAEVATVAAMCLVSLAVLSPLSYWSEETYGPRYLLFLVPLFVVLAGVSLGWSARVPVARVVPRRLLVGLLAAGVLIQLSTVIPRGGHNPCGWYVHELLGPARFDQNYCRFVPELSDSVLDVRMSFAVIRNVAGLGSTTLTYEPYVGAPGGTIERRTLLVDEKRPYLFWTQRISPGTLSLLLAYCLILAGGGVALRRQLRRGRSETG
jgi:hypothetical protein